MRNKLIVSLIVSLGLLALALPATAQLSTNTPPVPTSPDNFFNSALDYFTAFNTNNLACFNSNSVSFWAGVDSVIGGGAGTDPMANELGASINLYKGFSLEAVERNSGVSGTIVSLAGGADYGYVIVDTRVAAYADMGYEFDQDKILGEVGLRIAKALTTHTFAQIGYGLQFKSGPLAAGADKVGQILSAAVGFTF
jgi:hypothetical protein